MSPEDSGFSELGEFEEELLRIFESSYGVGFHDAKLFAFALDPLFWKSAITYDEDFAVVEGEPFPSPSFWISEYFDPDTGIFEDPGKHAITWFRRPYCSASYISLSYENWRERIRYYKSTDIIPVRWIQREIGKEFREYFYRAKDRFNISLGPVGEYTELNDEELYEKLRNQYRMFRRLGFKKEASIWLEALNWLHDLGSYYSSSIYYLITPLSVSLCFNVFRIVHPMYFVIPEGFQIVLPNYFHLLFAKDEEEENKAVFSSFFKRSCDEIKKYEFESLYYPIVYALCVEDDWMKSLGMFSRGCILEMPMPAFCKRGNRVYTKIKYYYVKKQIITISIKQRDPETGIWKSYPSTETRSYKVEKEVEGYYEISDLCFCFRWYGNIITPIKISVPYKMFQGRSGCQIATKELF